MSSVPSSDIPNPDSPARRPVGGWLTYFCLITIILRPIYLVRLLFAFNSLPHKGFCLAEIVVSLLAGSLVAGRSALAFAAIWVFSVVNLLQQLYLLFTGSRVATFDPHVTIQSKGTVIAGMAVTFAWLIYFHRSKRVKETFGSNL
jgi:hypothetical protein